MMIRIGSCIYSFLPLILAVLGMIAGGELTDKLGNAIAGFLLGYIILWVVAIIGTAIRR